MSLPYENQCEGRNGERDNNSETKCVNYKVSRKEIRIRETAKPLWKRMSELLKLRVTLRATRTIHFRSTAPWDPHVSHCRNCEYPSSGEEALEMKVWEPPINNREVCNELYHPVEAFQFVVDPRAVFLTAVLYVCAKWHYCIQTWRRAHAQNPVTSKHRLRLSHQLTRQDEAQGTRIHMLIIKG